MKNKIKPEHRCTRVLGRIRQLGLEQRRRLARLGALASVASERAHRWTPETARDAGRKGGLATARKRVTWWKLLYNTQTPTWQAFGRVAFVQASSESEAQAAGECAAQLEYPGAAILTISLMRSTDASAAAHFEKRRRLEEWMRNTRDGVPNSPSSIQPVTANASNIGGGSADARPSAPPDRDLRTSSSSIVIPEGTGGTRP